MTHDEMERAIAFLLEQMAALTVRTDQIAAGLLKAQNDIGLLREAVVGVMALTQKLAEGQLALEKKLAKTDDRLNAFILVVEKYITRDNGRKGGPAAT